MRILQKIFTLLFVGVLFMPFMTLADTAGIVSTLTVLNDTKNLNAQSVPASKEDFLTFTLKSANVSGAPVNGYVMSINLSQVLSVADITDKGGAIVNGSVLSFSPVSIPANGSVSKSFQVRIKYFLSGNVSYKLLATFGNQVSVSVSQPKVLGVLVNEDTEFEAPKTGADTNLIAGVAFALMLVGMYSTYKHRQALKGYAKH